jgi:hypothetical protein
MKCGLSHEKEEYKKILCRRVYGPERVEVLRDWRK